MFETEFAKVEYVEESNIVMHTWKKECSFGDYRTPVLESVKLLAEHKGSVFVVDARNGFEDVKEDVEWGFNYFLPQMQKTSCKKWIFIANEVSDIDGELDLWTKEIMKYFEVIRVTSLEDALKHFKVYISEQKYDFQDNRGLLLINNDISSIGSRTKKD